MAALPTAAIDFSLSAFGTVGYARSNQPYTYQRVIDDNGTFARDTVAGLQLDAAFADKFGATVQFKLAPASNSDNDYTGTVSWAFRIVAPDQRLAPAGGQAAHSAVPLFADRRRRRHL
jgi:hypothetical protein